MKKKFLLAFAVLSVLFCIFAVGASAATPIDCSDFNYDALENIEYRADDLIVFDDGFSCPSVCVFKDTNKIGNGQHGSPDGLKNALDFTYINGKFEEPDKYGFDDIDSIDIPQGVTTMNQYACNKLTTIRIVSIPDTLVTFGGTCFQNATGLEYCIFEHGENSTLTTLPGTMFSDSGLKAFSMPDCIKTLDGGNEFGNCKSLKAVYLSKNLTSITGPSSKNPNFDYCNKLYLVNEPFVAKSESDIPAEPTVYYFPENLAALGTADKAVFRGASSINDVLVFGEKVTSVLNRVMFQGSPANTVVFLGDMTKVVAYETYYWGTKNIIFANEADKSADDVELYLKSGTNNAYFCYGEAPYHVKELAKTTPATCTDAATSTDYCFCGQEIPNTTTTTAEALGHDHTTYLGTVYQSYMEQGHKEYECVRCGDVNTETKTPALFVCYGYSSPENGGGGIAIRFRVNDEAIDEYTTETGKTMKYGIFAVTKDKLGSDDIFANDGTAAKDVTYAEVSSHGFVMLELKITGFKDEYKELKLALGVFVAVSDDVSTEYSYLQEGTPNKDEKYCFVSYNDIANI